MKYLLMIWIFLFAACNSGESLQISDEDLDTLLFDLQVVQISVESSTPQTRDSLLRLYQQEVLEKHSMSDAELKSLQDDLKKDPERLKRSYDRVDILLDSLKRNASE